MRKAYDFSKARRNPYSKFFKKQVTMRLDNEIIAYFKNLAQNTGIPYQNLINLYLRNCVKEKKEPAIKWLK